MKRSIILFLTLVCGTFAFSQKAETIESIVSNSHEAEWYAAQMEAWQKVIDVNPQDEWAWRNLFKATFYHDIFTANQGRSWEEQDLTKKADVVRQIEARFPDSYVSNLCKCRFALSKDSIPSRRGDFVRRAVELMPENACAEDINYLACRMWIADPESPLVNELFTKSYRNKYYPARIMQFNRNMLLCMEPNAIYFPNGDLDSAPMKILQEALGERKDVTIINVSFLHADSFMEALYKKLNIKPLTINLQDYSKYGEDWARHYEADIIMYLIKESGRPAYFSPTNPKTTILDKDSIYNEGLVLKYSPKPYDNFSVAMHNVKEVYNLEYLAEPDLVYDNWETSGMTDMNHVTLLSNLISKFKKKGEIAQAEHLHNILNKCLYRCGKQFPTKAQEYFDNLLKEQIEEK